MINHALTVATRSRRSVCCAIICTIRGHRVKNWNIHSAWIIGILLAILIGSTSVDWNAIKDLPGIISFAVGLSSLILAVIAIFQTLSSTGSVEASLAAVRDASAGSEKVSKELAASAVIIQKAATDAQSASSSVLEATGDFVDISRSMIESSEAGRLAVSEFRQEMASKLSVPASPRSPTKHYLLADFEPEVMGGAAATYAAITSFEKSMPFKLNEIFFEDQSVSYEIGYLACLDDAGIINFSKNDGTYLITKIIFPDLQLKKASIRASKYSKITQEVFDKRIAQVDRYFDGLQDGDANAISHEA